MSRVPQGPNESSPVRRGGYWATFHRIPPGPSQPFAPFHRSIANPASKSDKPLQDGTTIVEPDPALKRGVTFI
jgi:hypothetical protein